MPDSRGPIRAVKAWGAILTVGLIYEGYAVLNSIPNDTLSEGAWWLTANHPLAVLPIAFLLGHLFWQSSLVYKHWRTK